MLVLKETFVVAPCDGTLALRLVTALRFLHVLPACQQRCLFVKLCMLAVLCLV